MNQSFAGAFGLQPAISTAVLQREPFDPPRHLPLIADAGFRIIELNLAPGTEASFDWNDRDKVQELQRVAGDVGIAVWSVHVCTVPNHLACVDETLRNMSFALCFQPLRQVRFWLGCESPVWRKPRDFGIRAVFNHPRYAAIFPSEVVKSVRFIIQAYRGDLGYQRRLWRPVREKLRVWEKIYASLHRGPGCHPILSLRDGKDFLISPQRSIDSP